MQYTIGSAAEKVGVSTSTLRYYDKEGLLPFVGRSAKGIRIFSDSDIDWLRLIECLKSTDMPIRDIKQFIDWSVEGDSTLEQRRDMFYERRRIVVEQIASLEKTLDAIRFKCWFYDTAVSAGTADVPANIKPEDMPPEIQKLKVCLDR